MEREKFNAHLGFVGLILSEVSDKLKDSRFRAEAVKIAMCTSLISDLLRGNMSVDENAEIDANLAALLSDLENRRGED